MMTPNDDSLATVPMASILHHSVCMLYIYISYRVRPVKLTCLYALIGVLTVLQAGRVQSKE